MKRVDGDVSSGERVRGISLANQLAAESFARNVAPTIQTLTAAGFISQRTLANELNQRPIPTARGGRWHSTTVQRLLLRLGWAGNGNGALAIRRIADARAEAVGPTIRELRKAGLSAKAIAHELNERRIPTARGGRMRDPNPAQPYRCTMAASGVYGYWRSAGSFERCWTTH